MIRTCFDKTVVIDTYECDGSTFLECYCRKKSFILQPEEEVRQAVLYYLLYHSKIDLTKFIIKVEHNSLDIAFYLKYDCPGFFPSLHPTVIFELKRDEINIDGCLPQLENYMSRFQCNTGVLTNSCDIILLNGACNRVAEKLNIINLENKINLLQLTTDEDISNFEKAKLGSLEAFIYLINKFGKTSKFTFLCKDYQIPITCFFFNILNEYILFDFCNTQSSKKQPKILKSNFLNLVSINE